MACQLDEDAPKYWEKKVDRVYPGVEEPEEAIPIRSLCGTYSIVLEDGPVGFEELENDPRNEKDRRTFVLQAKSKGKDDLEEVFCGEFRIGPVAGTFSAAEVAHFGVVRPYPEDNEDIKEEYKRSAQSPDGDGTQYGDTLKNLWDITGITWDESADVDSFDIFSFAPTRLLDGNGNRFLEIKLDESEEVTRWLAKKQTSAAAAFLVEEERARLGMGMSEEDIRERANKDNPEPKDGVEAGNKAGHCSVAEDLGDEDKATKKTAEHGV